MSDMKTCAKCGGALLYGANGYGGKVCNCNFTIFQSSAEKDKRIAELEKQVAELLQASEPVAYRGSALCTSMADWTYEDTKEQLIEFGCTFIEPLYISPPNTQPHNPAVYTDNSVVIANMQAKLNKAREALLVSQDWLSRTIHHSGEEFSRKENTELFNYIETALKEIE